MSFTFTFSAEAAQNAGASPFISECGAFAGTLSGVKATYGQNGSQSAGLEFAFNTPQGDAPFLSLYVTKRDGTESPQGFAMMCAMVAITRISLPNNATLEQVAAQLEGKQIGLVLQKVLQMKGDGVTETFKMDIKQAYLPANRCTAKELYAKQPAKDVDALLATLTVRDNRTQRGGQQGQAGTTQGGQNTQQQGGAVDQDLGW